MKAEPMCAPWTDFDSVPTIDSLFTTLSQADGRPPCINGDFAIQWEWSNFDPSQNQNPLTDYEKTLHNSLGLRDEHVTHNLCQSTLRERLGKYKYVKYKVLSFLF